MVGRTSLGQMGCDFSIAIFILFMVLKGYIFTLFFIYFYFRFGGLVFVLIVSVSGNCLFLYFQITIKKGIVSKYGFTSCVIDLTSIVH